MRKPLLAASLSLLFVPWSGVPASAAVEDPLVYHSLTPCLLFDTRPTFGGEGSLGTGETREFHVVGSTSDFVSQGGTAGGCGVPGFTGADPQTQSVFINIVAIDPTGGGNLKAWPADEAEPVQGGVVNYQQLTPNLNNSNATALGVRQDTEGDDISIKANGAPVHVRGVALGYFDLGEGFFWALGGNAGTTPGTNFLGTTDNQAFQVHVNDQRALRIVPGSSPNLIGGWSGNSVTAGVVGATIGGGGCTGCVGTGPFPNVVTDDFGTVGGGANNRAGDGLGTTADRRFATVGGGRSNTASNTDATVGGGSDNSASGAAATVGGGFANTASGDRAAVGGGESNTAGGVHATVGGGFANTANGIRAMVGGGRSNIASGLQATVGGGLSNTASGSEATVGGGGANTASGFRATVPGGDQNTAAGDYSLAAGRRAKANHNGAFVWADSSDFNFASTAVNQFNVRATGGSRIVSGINAATGVPNAGVTLAAGGGSWSSISDRELKEGVAPVDPTLVLEGVVAMPITSWSYQAQDPSIRHIGPMAQDFHDAFGVGEDQRYITGVDADGVALAAIQGLNERMEERNDQLEARLAAVESERPTAGGTPSAGWWGLSAALALAGLGLGRRWGLTSRSA